jgi:hypothetical protein
MSFIVVEGSPLSKPMTRCNDCGFIFHQEDFMFETAISDCDVRFNDTCPNCGFENIERYSEMHPDLLKAFYAKNLTLIRSEMFEVRTDRQAFKQSGYGYEAGLFSVLKNTEFAAFPNCEFCKNPIYDTLSLYVLCYFEPEIKKNEYHISCFRKRACFIKNTSIIRIDELSFHGEWITNEEYKHFCPCQLCHPY